MDFKENNVNQEQQQVQPQQAPLQQQPLEQQQANIQQAPIQQQLNQVVPEAPIQQAAQEEGQVQQHAEAAIEANEPKALQQPPLVAANVKVGEVRKDRMSFPTHNYGYMKELNSRLNASKYGKKDGKEMQKIKELHSEILGYQTMKINLDDGGRSYESFMRTMRELCAWCDKYISNHNPWSDAGKERLRLVKELRAKTNLQADSMSAVRGKALETFKGATYGDLMEVMSKGVQTQYEEQVGNESQTRSAKYADVVVDVQTQAMRELNARKLVYIENENTDNAIKLRNEISIQFKKKTNYLAVRDLSEFVTGNKQEFEDLLKTYGNYNKEEDEQRKTQLKEELDEDRKWIDERYEKRDEALAKFKASMEGLKSAISEKKDKISDYKKKEQPVPEDLKNELEESEKELEKLERQVSTIESKCTVEVNEYRKAMANKVKDYRTTELVKRRNDALPKRIEALNRIKDKIYGLDLNDISFLSDDSLVACSEKLENISRKVKAFRSLMKANPEYMASLSEAEAMKLTDKMDVLESVSNYYRIRKLLISEPEYVKRLKDFSIEDAPGDDFETVRIKKLMRVSYYLGENMKSLAGIAPTAGPVPGTKTQSEKMLKATLLNGSKLDFKKSDYYELDEKGKPILQNYRHFLPEHDLICSNIEAIINQCEQEKFFVPEEDEKSVKLIAPDKYNKRGGLHAVATKWDFYVDAELQEERAHMLKAISEIRNEECKGQFRSPTFSQSLYHDFDKMSLSDHLDRMNHFYSSAFLYRRTEEDVKETLRALSIEGNKEYLDLLNDPEAIEYYESMYAEHAMKQFAAQYAVGQRLANAFGDKIFFEHSVDIALQMSKELKVKMLICSISTNSTNRSNLPHVKALFEKYNSDKRYIFDTEDFAKTSGAIGSLGMQLDGLTGVGGPAMMSDEDRVGIDQYEADLMNASKAEAAELKEQIKEMKEIEKSLFGDSKFYKYMISEVEKDIEKNPKAEWAKYAKGHMDVYDFIFWYFARLHPEMITTDFFNAKDKDGNYILLKYLRKGRGVYNQGNDKDVTYLLNKKDCPWRRNFDEKTRNDYKESLEKRKFCPMVDNPDDPYDLNREYADLDGRPWEEVQEEKRQREQQGRR
ncbi:MAG: hypothetical protein K6G12_06130 [Lachnospiraceae bacterium]|nr:hypothetical protein [Lachnospiraceae bacterium]